MEQLRKLTRLQMLTVATGIAPAGFVDGFLVSEAIQNHPVLSGSAFPDPIFFTLSNCSPSLKRTAPLEFFNPLHFYHLSLLSALVRDPTHHHCSLILPRGGIV